MSKYDSRSMNTNESGKVDVGSLLREGADDQQALSKLREQYPNDKELVNKMFSEWEEQNNRIRRKAKKFAELILTRYNHLGPKRIMEKARKLKKKYNFSDDEFQGFINIALSDKAFSATNMYNTPNTPMGKALGQLDASMARMNIKANEMDVLQEILRMHQDNSALHTQVVLQSLTFQEFDAPALMGKYDPNRHNLLVHVHPIVAALFLPRIKYLDEHMLIGSISSIVASRHQNTPIKDRPTWELYWDIITDPNEMSCVNNRDSAIVDLRNRAKLQVELWKCVLNLRQGKYYAPEVAGFLPAVDQCRNYVFDSADYMLVRDEGTILRRLLGAFSFRPTVVSFSPYMYQTQSFNYPINTMAATQVTTIPIVNLRLPHAASSASFNNPMFGSIAAQSTEISLENALNQSDYYVENKMIVPKLKSVIYSRNVLFFYINRRFQSMNYMKLNAPYLFQRLPITTSGFEALNDKEVNYSDGIISVGSEKFNLKSVVVIDKMASVPHLAQEDKDIFGKNTELIVGCSAIFKTDSNDLRYDPLSANKLKDKDVVTTIKSVDMTQTFGSRAKTSGTIFVFIKDETPAPAPVKP